MGNLNQCNFVGRLGQEPEQKAFPDGTAVCNISIASSKKFKDRQTGEPKEITTWVNLVFVGRTAEVLCQYCKKGDRIRVTTEYRNRQYEKDGQTRYAHEFFVREMEFLESASSGDSRLNQQQNAYGSQGQTAPQQQAPAQQAQSQQPSNAAPMPNAPPGFDGFEDDIPFRYIPNSLAMAT